MASSSIRWALLAAGALSMAACASGPGKTFSNARAEEGVIVATRIVVVAETPVDLSQTTVINAGSVPATVTTTTSRATNTVTTSRTNQATGASGATSSAPTGVGVRGGPQAAVVPPLVAQVPIAAIVDQLGPGMIQRGVSYTVRRDADGTLMEVTQPQMQGLAPGTRVHITYDGRVRVAAAS